MTFHNCMVHFFQRAYPLAANSRSFVRRHYCLSSIWLAFRFCVEFSSSVSASRALASSFKPSCQFPGGGEGGLFLVARTACQPCLLLQNRAAAAAAHVGLFPDRVSVVWPAARPPQSESGVLSVLCMVAVAGKRGHQLGPLLCCATDRSG